MASDSTFVANDRRMVSITRLFDAPRERVFRAWTTAESLERWYAPHGCTIQFKKFDFRPGGSFHSCIRIPDGHECWCVGEYREIVPPQRIVLTMVIADEQGRVVSPAEIGMDPEWPSETVVTVTFAEEAGKTRLVLVQTVLESLAKRTGAHPSWLQMLDRLADELQSA